MIFSCILLVAYIFILFFIISCSFLLRMRNVSGKICGGNQNRVFSNFFLFENPVVYEIMWEKKYIL